MFSITIRVSADPSLPVRVYPGTNSCVPPHQDNYTRQVFGQPLAQHFTNTDEDATGPGQKL